MFSPCHINRTQWSALVATSPVSNYFQTPECYDFYSSLTFLEPFAVGVDENGELKGVACGYFIADGGKLKRYFSRRAIIPGGLLLADDITNDALRRLLEKLKNELSGKSIYIEIRNYQDYTAYKSGIESAGFSYVPHYDYLVDTTDGKATFERFSKSKKRQINAAQRKGYRWSTTTDDDEIETFYRLLKHLYRTKVKRPIFPLEFLKKLAVNPHGKILVVKKGETVVGGMACAIEPAKKVYEWYVCGDVMATYAGIDYAVQNGIPYFDFMGAGSPDKSYGVRDFKSKFGGKLLEYGRFLYICNHKLYRLGTWAVRYLY